MHNPESDLPMKLLILADMDDFHWKQAGGNADAILSCGDTYDQLILEAAQAYSCSRIFAVKGNHDANTPFPAPIMDLHLHVCEHGGLRFGGMHGSYRYKPAGHFIYSQEKMQELFLAFPAVDVFLSHNSPRGIHERDNSAHQGFDGLLGYMQKTKPALVIHGHQHTNQETVVNGTRIISVHGYRLIEFNQETL